MVEKRPWLTFFTNAILVLGVAIVAFPVYIALVASTHPADELIGRVPGWFGGAMIDNYATVLGTGMEAAGGVPIGRMMLNSLVMALVIAIGKIAISLTSA